MSTDRIAAVAHLRRRQTGLAVARLLGMTRSTVGLILRRLGPNRLDRLEPWPPAIRYEKDRPGEMILIGLKSLGRIEGVGHRITGQPALYHRARSIGYLMPSRRL